MLHAYFTPISICFIYTSLHFYAFSGTNLLTRCRRASSCFLLFLCFRKVTQEIFSELDNSKAEVPIFPDTSTESKAETKEGAEVATPPLGADPPLAAPRHGEGPSGAHRPRPSAYKFPPDAKTLNHPASIHEKFRSSAAIEDKFRGTEVSILALFRDEELPPEPSPSTPPPSSSPLLTPMMRR